MQWVATVGRQGPDVAWVERHVHVVANLGGPLLGAMGPLTSLLSGESHMGAMSVLLAPLLRNLLGDEGQTRMRDVARTWGSLYEILPKGASKLAALTWLGLLYMLLPGFYLEPHCRGGDLVWGTRSDPTDCRCDLITRKGKPPLSVAEGVQLLLNLTDMSPEPVCSSSLASCIPNATWDPFVHSLPLAPKLKIYCMYGVGLRTERAYSYTDPELGDEMGRIDYKAHSGSDDAYAMGAVESARMDYGLSTVDGDGTVPLLSLGYLCKGLWREASESNPGKVSTVVREYIDMSSSMLSDTRGGPKSSKHVEMLGNHDVIRDVMHIVAGRDGHLAEDRIFSRIGEISWRVNKRLRKSKASRKTAPP